MRFGTNMAVVCAMVAAAFAMVSGCKSSGARAGGTISCTPGSRVEVACGAGCGLGSCTGDPVLDVCDGTTSVGSCTASSALGTADDTCGGTRCPGLTVVCPSSGVLTVAPRGYGGSTSYTCNWDSRVTSSAPLIESPDAGE